MHEHPSSPGPDSRDPLQRILFLEEQLAFQQHTLDGLGEVIQGHQAQLEHLKSQLGQMRLLVERLSSQGLGENLPHEKPPHY